MPIREGCWSAQGPGNGGTDAAMSKIAKPGPQFKSLPPPIADDCPAAHIPIHIPTHISLHCLQGKLAPRMACDRPHQRSWLRRFRTHARLGSFQAFSRTLDASSADAVHTSQGSGADPSFLTPWEGGKWRNQESHHESLMRVSIQRPEKISWLPGCSAYPAQWRLGRGEVSTVASKSCVVKSAPLPAPYYGAATGLGGRSSWLAKEAFDRALQVASP